MCLQCYAYFRLQGENPSPGGPLASVVIKSLPETITMEGIMTRTQIALALLSILLAGRAAAWDGITVLSITAGVDFELYVDASPTPYCWHYWDWHVEGYHDLPTLHQTFDTDETPCTSTWLIHADADSLAWHGSWPAIDPDSDVWNDLHDGAELDCRVYFSAPVRLLARRAVTGALIANGHTVHVVPLVGDPLVMLEEDGGPDEAELELQPGTYDLVLHILAHERGTHYAYDGAVHLTWEPQGGSPVQPTSWSTIKALYD
jgi:hypothetical protein